MGARLGMPKTVPMQTAVATHRLIESHRSTEAPPAIKRGAGLKTKRPIKTVWMFWLRVTEEAEERERGYAHEHRPLAPESFEYTSPYRRADRISLYVMSSIISQV